MEDKAVIIQKPHLCTRLPILYPRYRDRSHDKKDWVVLLAKYKVHHGSGVLLIEFTKAKHLVGQRFAIRRSVVEKCPVESNGRIECYVVPFNKLESWVGANEVPAILETWPELEVV